MCTGILQQLTHVSKCLVPVFVSLICADVCSLHVEIDSCKANLWKRGLCNFYRSSLNITRSKTFHIEVAHHNVLCKSYTVLTMIRG